MTLFGTDLAGLKGSGIFVHCDRETVFFGIENGGTTELPPIDAKLKRVYGILSALSQVMK